MSQGLPGKRDHVIDLGTDANPLAQLVVVVRGHMGQQLLAAGQPLDPFWYGKIDIRHLGIVGELAERGILHAPALVPEFLAAPDVTARIAAFRNHPSYSSLL